MQPFPDLRKSARFVSFRNSTCTQVSLRAKENGIIALKKGMELNHQLHSLFYSSLDVPVRC